MNLHTRNKSAALLALPAFLFTAGSLLAQSTTDFHAQSSGGSPLGGIVPLLIGILVIVGLWKIFVKAGQPGWASIIPIYNTYIICKIAGRPGWWVLLLLVPLLNIIIGIILMIDLAKSFGKGAGYGIGMLFLGFVFIPMLGLGDATYQGAPAR